MYKLFKDKNNKFIIFLFLFSLIIRLITLFLIKTPVFSDFETMYNASKEIINGTDNYKNTTYFITWGYQMGHVIYQSLLLKVWDNIIFLKIMNSLITSLIPVFIYLISKKVANDKTSKIVSILYTLFPFALFLNTVLTNQHLPLLLNLIAIYLIINLNYNKKIKLKSIIIGLLLGIANILRSEGIVIIFSLFLYSIYLIIKKYNIKKIITSFLSIILAYFLIFNFISFILIKTDLSLNGLKNMNPTWKFVAGFNYNTNGVYDSSDAALYSGYNQVKEAKKELIKRVSEYEKIPTLFLKKTKILWFNSDLSWSIGYIVHTNDKLYNGLTNINQIFIIVFNILMILSFYSLKKIKEITNTQILISFILFIYFGVYLLIEVMPRYTYGLQPFIFILSSITIQFVLENICRKRFK